MLFRKRKYARLGGLFNGHFIEVKALYVLEFDAICCVSFIGELDTTKAFAFITETMGTGIVRTYQHAWFEHGDKKMFFNNTIFVLEERRMIELAGNYCQVLHTPLQHSWANGLVESLSAFRMVNNEPVIGFVRQAATN